jgi:hypothetical protein
VILLVAQICEAMFVKLDLATDGAASDTGGNSPVVGCSALGPNRYVADVDMMISSMGF